MTARSRAIAAAGLGAAAVLPWLLPADYYLHLANLALIWALLTLSLNIVLGYAGQIALGHAGFFGIGAYTAALVTEGRHGLLAWPGLVAAGVVAGIAGLVLGIPTLRLRGHYLALATLGFGEIMRHIFFNWKAVTRGMDGIGGVPAPSLGVVSIAGERPFFYLIGVVLVVVIVLSYRLERSKYGRAFKAVREAELAAGAAGVNVTGTKILAFVLSSAVAGMAGALYAYLTTFISPDVFVFDVSASVLCMLLVGGIGSVGGAVFGAVVLTALPELLRVSKSYYMLLYGAGIVAMVVFLPDGLVGLGRLRVRRRSAAAPVDPPGVRAAPAAPAAPVSDGRPMAPGTEGALLHLEGLGKRFGGLVAVDRVDLDVRPGRIHALIGPNGSGKSTIVNLVTGIYRPSAGVVRFAGRSIGGRSSWEIAGQGLARTFQNLRLFRSMTVWENVMVACQPRHGASLASVLVAAPGAIAEERAIQEQAAELLQFVGLWDVRHRVVASLPHEQQRLCEIARALGLRPRLLMLDEPAAGMNPTEAGRLIDRILHLRAAGLTIFLIEHNMHLVMRVADVVSVLNFGKKIAEGAPREIQDHPAVIEAYLGHELLAEAR